MKVNSGLWLLDQNTWYQNGIWEYDKNLGTLVFSSSSRLKDWIAVMGCCIPTDRSNTSALHSRSPNYRKVKSRWKPTNLASNFLLPIPVIAKPWWNVQQKSGLQETNEKAQQQKSYRAKLTKRVSMSKQKASTDVVFSRERIGYHQSSTGLVYFWCDLIVT